MVFLSVIFLIAGLALLYFGADFLVENASKLAIALGLNPIVIGLTVVAFGTSLPELAASLTATLRGAPALSIGNVIGSNIANLGLVLAISAIIAVLTVSRKFVWREMTFMFGVSLLLPFSLWTGGVVNRFEGAFLFALLLFYTWFLFKTGGVEDLENDNEPSFLWKQALFLALGIVMLVGGAHLTVKGAVSLASLLGISEHIIGITIIAIGTSLPELATCVVAAKKREIDLLMGNLVGSNIFNVLSIIGITSLVKPIEVTLSSTGIDIAIMLTFALVTWLFLCIKYSIGKFAGGGLLLGYIGYVGYLAFTIVNGG